MARFAFVGMAVAGFALHATVALGITQPDGTPIPQNTSLQTHLAAQGEPINPATDANSVPETFTPECALTFTLILRDSGYNNAFGWYNVTGAKPSDAELYEFIAATDCPGSTPCTPLLSKVLDVHADPRYKGGDIAFYERTPENVFYSEKAWNPDGPTYVHLLIMDSKIIPAAFYFGWEDLLATGGNDNDFQDILIRVEGIQCTGGGEKCDVGALGPCQYGAMQCVNGALGCVQTTKPQDEKCNNIDDDCNGAIDDPPNLCPEKEICYRGACTPSCGSGEFKCKAGLVCNKEGLCVEKACETVSCDAGKVCSKGVCVDACDGVICPWGTFCLAGGCVDPCEHAECAAGTHCENGVCVKGCECGGCPPGMVCDATSKCVDPTCKDAPLPPGTHCEPGPTIVENCKNVICPLGGVCAEGKCGPPADAGPPKKEGGIIFAEDGGSGPGPGVDPGAGSGDSASGGPGPSTSDGGVVYLDDGAVAPGSAGTTGGGVAAPGATPPQSAGCGCRTAPERGRGGLWAVLGVAGFALARRRRRAA